MHNTPLKGPRQESDSWAMYQVPPAPSYCRDARPFGRLPFCVLFCRLAFHDLRFCPNANAATAELSTIAALYRIVTMS